MIKLFIESANNIFDTSSTGSDTGDCISNKKMGNVTLRDYYKFEKGQDGIITYMTADDYINHCIKDIFNSNYDRTVNRAVDTEKVKEYSDLMQKGINFPMCYLNYVSKQQEGRHRALAFADAFGKDTEFPVLEIYPTDVTDDEIYDYCERKWGNGDDWFEYVASGLGRTEKEINDYLGIAQNEKDSEYSDDTETYEPADFDDIDDLISDEIVAEIESDFEDDYDGTMKELSKKSGLSIDEIETLNDFEFTRLLTKYC